MGSYLRRGKFVFERQIAYYTLSVSFISFVVTAVLFQDAVILGAANEPMPLECTSPAPTSLSPQAFPFCTLERTVSILSVNTVFTLKFQILFK